MKALKINKLSFGQYAIRLFLAVLALCTIYPFWYIICVSLSTYDELIKKTLLAYPAGFTLSSIAYVLSTPDILNIFKNTLFVVIIGTFMGLIVTVLFAYPLARKVPGHRWILFFIFFTILFSGGMIPTFMVVKVTGLLNSLWALILPRLMDPFYVFLMRNYINSIPESLDEAASVEGAGTGWILLKVILPLSTPGIATIGLFYAVFYWNQFFDAVIYISSRLKWTIQVLLREMLITVQPDILGTGMSGAGASDNPNLQVAITLKMATVVVATLPFMMIYPFIQRYFVKGMMVGALKG